MHSFQCWYKCIKGGAGRVGELNMVELLILGRTPCGRAVVGRQAGSVFGGRGIDFVRLPLAFEE